MADISIRNDDGTGLQDNFGDDDKSKTRVKTLILEAQFHLMLHVDPWLAGCRHLAKPVLEEVHKFERAILEHPDGRGGVARRVIKENGFSCEPYYVDRANRRIKLTKPE